MIIYGATTVPGKEPVLESLCLSQMSRGTGFYLESGRLPARTSVSSQEEGKIPVRHGLSHCPSR